MKVAVLLSGGKDSCLALSKASEFHEVVCLISLKSRNPDSFMFHTPNIDLVSLQAEALGLPLIVQDTMGNKEEEIKDLRLAIETAISEFEIEGVVSGAVLSVYQSTRVQKVCHGLNVFCFNPLWQLSQWDLLHELEERGIRAIVSSVASEPFDDSWLGREINSSFAEDLRVNAPFVNPAGEGGEYESLVLDMPLFKKRIEVKRSSVSYDNFVGLFSVEEAVLCEK